MTDHPILFQPTMIDALCAGRKSQTRRLPNTTNTLIDGRGWQRGEIDRLDWSEAWLDNGPSPAGNAGPYLKVPKIDGETIHRIYPRVQVGDRLWVRERWRVGAWHYNNSEIAVDYTTGPRKEWLFVEDPDQLHRLISQSRDDAKKAEMWFGDGYWEHTWPPGNSPCRWRPSIHLPRWASRTTLPVTNVRIQRLQDISQNDAEHEGIEQVNLDRLPATWKNYAENDDYFYTPVDSFRTLITTINGPEAWAENRWVLAYSFEAPTAP